MNRIESAWEKCRDWITFYEGMVTETCLRNVPISYLATPLYVLVEKSTTFELGQTWDDEETVHFSKVPPDLSEAVELLASKRLHYLIADYVVPLGDFDFFNRFIITGPGEESLIDLDIIWWANEAFPAGTNHKSRFSAIMEYFFSLQTHFDAQQLFVAPENLDWPPEKSDMWVEV